MEMPVTICEGAGLTLERDDPVCPIFSKTFVEWGWCAVEYERSTNKNCTTLDF